MAINDIVVSIAGGSISGDVQSSRTLLVSSGTTEIGPAIINQADWENELSALGVSSTSKLYKMVEQYFTPSNKLASAPKDVAVYEKVSGTDYDDALDALSFSDFYTVCIDSSSDADNATMNTWVQSETDPPRFFLGQTDTKTLAASYDNPRSAFIVNDKVATTGYQEISSSPTKFVGDTVPAITTGTYSLDITIDGGSLNQLNALSIADTDDWDDIAATIQSDLRSATGSTETVTVTTEGKIKVSSATSGLGSSVVVAEGTGAAADGGLIAAIDGLTDYSSTIETAVDGAWDFMQVGWVSRKLAGGEPYKDWKWKDIPGSVATDYSVSDLTTIRNSFMQSYVEKNSIAYTDGGTTTQKNLFIDLRFGNDFIKLEMENDLVELFANEETIPLDNTGIRQIEQAIRKRLKIWGDRGYIARITPESSEADKSKSDDKVYMFRVIMPTRSEISDANRASRILEDARFSFTPAGSFHKVEVSGSFAA